MSKLLTLPLARVQDANGTIYPGALLDCFLTGTTTPASVYADAALTTPHENPVEADAGGFLPAMFLDPAVSYRFRARTSAGVNISGMDFDPITGVTASEVRLSNGRTLQTFFDGLPLHVEDYRYNGLTERTDLETWNAAITALVASSGVLVAEKRTYDFGDISGTTPLVDMIGLRNSTIDFAGATVKCNSSGVPLTRIFRLRDCRDVVLRNVQGTDDGYNPEPLATPTGCALFEIDGTTAESVNITFDQVYAHDLNTGILIDGTNHAVRQVHIVPNCRFENVYYGFNCQENGDDITGGYSAVNCIRPYFPYGVHHHDLTIHIFHDGFELAGNQAILIKRYDVDTSNINLRVCFTGSLAYGEALVQIEHQNDDADARFDDITIDLHVERGTLDPNDVFALAFRSYTGATPAVEETASTTKAFSGITLMGDLAAMEGATKVKSYITDTSTIDLHIDTGTRGLDTGDISPANFGGHKTRLVVNAADDAAAATAGVPIGQMYRNGSVLMVRVA